MINIESICNNWLPFARMLAEGIGWMSMSFTLIVFSVLAVVGLTVKVED